MASFLRSHRRQSGLTQREVARLVGIISEAQVSRHERAADYPGFRVALAYEALFQVPLARLFPEPYEAVERNVAEQLSLLRSELELSTAKGRVAAVIARKLEWMTLRTQPENE